MGQIYNWTDDVFAGSHQVQTDMQNIENNLMALKNSFKGDTAPTSPLSGQWWYDISDNILKLRNEANTVWLDVYDFENQRAFAAKTLPDISVIAGTGLSGGGALDENRTLTHSPHTGDVTGTTVLTLVPGSITMEKNEQYTASSAHLIEYSDSQKDLVVHTGTGYTLAKEIYIPRGGTLRVSFAATCNFAGGYAAVFRSGVQVGTTRSVTVGYQTWSEDISGWSPEDLVQIKCWRTGGGVTFYIKEFRLYAHRYFHTKVVLD